MSQLRFLLIFLAFLISVKVYPADKDSLELALKNADPKNKAEILNKLSSEYLDNAPEKSIEFAKLALSESQKTKSKKQEAIANNNLGSYFWSQSDYKKALEHYGTALDISKTIKDSAGIAEALGNIGVTYRFDGNYKVALDYYLQAFKIYEGLKDKEGMATYLNNIGRIYEIQKNHDKAIELYTQALKIFEEIKNYDGIGTLLNNIGLIYDKKSQPAKALEYYMKSLKIVKEHGDKFSQAISFNNVGYVYKKLGDYQRALNYYNDAYRIKQHLGEKRGQARLLLNMAEVYKLKKEFETAAVFANRAFDICKNSQLKELYAETNYFLAFLKYDLNAYKEAFDHFHNYVIIKDSLLSERNNRHIAEMQTKFETTQKEKEIELLQKEKEIYHLNNEKQKAEISKQKLFRNSFLACMVLLSCSAFLLYNRNKIRKKANEQLELRNKEIMLQKEIIEEKNKDILDSIKYAKRIQEAIFPPEKIVADYLPGSFIYYNPRDIVSGDFYWLEKKNDSVFFAAVDCTGHGVPGAFMSIVGSNILKQSVNEHGHTKPSDILDDLNVGVSETLRQTYEESTVRDGMDIALCTLNFQKRTLQFAGANNPLYLVRNKGLIEIKADKFPIGTFVGEELKKFNNHLLDLQTGDQIYIFSDGFSDQFGGIKGKKFKYKQLKEVLLGIAHLSPQEQKDKLENTFLEWKGNFEQVDDVLVIGVKV